MKAIWDPMAREAKSRIATYIRNEFGIKRAKRFRQEVDNSVTMLLRAPNIGQIDPLFEGRAKTYRSIIVNGLSKMVYYIEDDTIYIVAFWDTRMEPEQQAARVK